VNPDHLLTQEMQNDVTQQLAKQKIHVALIQETHIPRNINIIKNGYRIITSAAKPNPKSKPEHDIPGKYIAGVAIAIHQELTQHISNIKRIDERIMAITLGREHTHTPITLLVTYAPHQGYNNHEKTKHWELVQQTLQDIPKHHMTIWGADANGQLGRDEARPELYNKIAGPYTNKKPRKRKWRQTNTTMPTTPDDTDEHLEKNQTHQEGQNANKTKHIPRNHKKRNNGK